MFHFREVTLVNNGFFPNVTFQDLHEGHTIITGENGAGKSTFVDSIILALGGAKLTNDRPVGEHIGQSSNQALIIAVVTNPFVQGSAKRRLFHPVGCGQDKVTLVCRLTRQGSNPKRDYLILDGHHDHDSVIDVLRNTGKTYSTTRFRDRLSEVGLSQDVLDMLIIRQDTVNQVCVKNPRQVYEFILRALGNPRILSDYEKALEELTQLETEIVRVEKSLLDEEHELEVRRADLRRYQRYADAKDKEEEYQKLKQASELRNTLHAFEETERKYHETQQELAEQESIKAQAEKAHSDATTVLQEIRKEEISLVDDLQAAKGRQQTMRSRVDELTPDYERFRTARENLKRLTKKSRDIAKQDLERAESALDAAKQASARIADEVHALEYECQSLAQKRPVYPRPIAGFYDALRSEGIDFEVLAQLVDPKDDILEDALGDHRFSVVVSTDREADAVRIAKQHNFIAAIATYGDDDGYESVSAVVQASAPTWLKDYLGSVQTKRIGYRDNYGHWVRRSTEHVLGSKDYDALLNDAKRRLARKEADARDAATELAHARDKHNEGQRIFVEVRQREDAQATLQELKDIERRHEEAEATLAAAKRDYDVLDIKKSSISQNIKLAKGAADGSERALNESRRKAKRLADGVEALTNRYHEQERAIEARRQGLEASYVIRAKQDTLSAPEEYARLIEEQERILNEYEEPPSPSIVDVVSKSEANVKEFRTNISKRREERGSQIDTMSQARLQYITLVNQLFTDYKRRLKAMQDYVDVRIECVPPEFDPNHTTDDDIRKAEFPIKVGFGGKPPVNIAHRGLSGGQRSLSGLMLLMALPEENSNGFYIIDEPYGNLSVGRVEDVSGFISRTPHQIMFTLPTSFDPGHYSAGSRVINFLHAEPGRQVAPPPQMGIV